MRNLNLFGIRIHDISDEELDTLLTSWLRTDSQKIISTPNPEILLDSVRIPSFRSVLNRSDLLLPDGIGLQYALWFSGLRRTHRHTGVDTVERLARLCEREGKSILLFGGEDDSGTESVERLRSTFPGLRIFHLNPGFLEMRESKMFCFPDILRRIKRFSPDVLIVALGHLKQEVFLNQYLSSLPSVKIAIGVGGALDMISQKKPRAPKFLRKIGLEWLWRLYLEPSRFRRIWRAVVVFPIFVVWSTLRRRLFTKTTV